MRTEIKNWLMQAEEDLDSAEKNFEINKHYLVSFLCQQAVEKGLKALILAKSREKPIGHSLIYLGKLAGVPKKYFSELKKLSPQYFISRYPDISEDIPYELYDEESSKNFLKIAREVIEWIKGQLK